MDYDTVLPNNENIKKVKTNKHCQWCYEDMLLKYKADYQVSDGKVKEYICQGHYDYVMSLFYNGN